MSASEDNGFTASALIIMYFLLALVLYPGLDESPYLVAQSGAWISFAIPFLYITYANIRLARYGGYRFKDFFGDLAREMKSPAHEWLFGVFATLLLACMIIPAFLAAFSLLILGLSRVAGVSSYWLYATNWGMWAVIAQVAIIFAARIRWGRDESDDNE
jgi:hypothetical protein